MLLKKLFNILTLIKLFFIILECIMDLVLFDDFKVSVGGGVVEEARERGEKVAKFIALYLLIVTSSCWKWFLKR